MAKEVKKQNAESGFSLLEVMIALTIFSIFITVYVTSQGYNIMDSTLLKEEVRLKELCTQKINEIIIKPPQFREALTLTTETASFENDKNYEAKITYKRLKIPDMKKIMGKDEEDENDNKGGNAPGSNAIADNFMNKIKENLQEMIWQVEVQVVNKDSKASYTLSTWLTNTEAAVKPLDTM